MNWHNIKSEITYCFPVNGCGQNIRNTFHNALQLNTFNEKLFYWIGLGAFNELATQCA